MIKNSPANAGRHKRGTFDPEVRKIPWRRIQERKTLWQPIPVFLPGESHDRGTWQATVHGVTRESVMTEQLNNNNNNKNNNTGNFMKLLVYPKNACVPHSRIFCISYRDNCAQHFRGSCLPRKKSFSSLCARNSMFP